MTLFTGAATALVTPFKNRLIDFDAFEKLIEMQLEGGISALVVCGTTGEAATLSETEQTELVKFAVNKAGGAVPVIAGAGSNNTAHAVHMSKQMEKCGADGLLLVTPYYNKCSQKGLLEYYRAIADSVNIPCILYSVPVRTGVNINAAVAAELSTHPNIAGIKEASGNISQVADIARFVSPDFALYSGNDDMTVPILSLGGSGVISTVANIVPKDMDDMVKLYLNGNVAASRDLQLRLKPLIDAMFIEVNPIPVKAALNILGLIEKEYRSPLCSPENKNLYEILNALEDYGMKV